MATLSLSLKASAAIVVPFAPPVVDPAPQAQGIEGRKVQEAAKAALRHWNDRTARLLLNEGEPDELSYVSVPMERAFSVKVKYRYVGEMKPLAYPLED